MRILFLHNRYRSEGGEERAVAEMSALLERRGHTVRVLQRSSAELTRSRAARALLRGGESPDPVAEAIDDLGADVVHVHNPHPRFGWRALAAAQARGVRTVLHLHNFRLYCSIGVAFRDGAPCHECRGRHTLPGFVHRCRGTLAESAVYAAGLSRQQPRLLEHADRLITLSHAHARLLQDHGLPQDGLMVIPNPVAPAVTESAAASGTYALMSGRLVEEKGFETAIRAAAAANVPLVVAGTGPDEPRLRQLAADPGLKADVRFAGWVAPARLARLRAGAALALVPSRCEEACPYAVLDALAAGLPVLVSDRGGLPEMAATPDHVLPADDEQSWALALGALMRDGQVRRSSGEAALQKAREMFGEKRAYEQLMEVYG